MSPKVLYIRADPELIRLLNRLVERERQERRGCRVSRSDVVRRLLWEGVAAATHAQAGGSSIDALPLSHPEVEAMRRASAVAYPEEPE